MASGTGEAGEHPAWKIVASRTEFDDGHVRVVTAKVETPHRPDGHSWTVVQRKGAVVIAPIDDEGRLILIRQERIPIQETIWEVPAGQIDDDGSELEAVARRELLEETGYELAPRGEWLALGDFFSSPGFTDEHSYCFLARPVRFSASGHLHGQGETILDCRAFTPAEVGEMIARNEIRDANTLGVFAKLTACGLL